MQERILHRGPDDQGRWMGGGGGRAAVGLVHCRLAVIDLDHRACQPMADRSGRLRLVFNGEIYNYRELRKELADEPAASQPGDDKIAAHAEGVSAPPLTPGSRQDATAQAWRTESDTEVILAAYARWGTQCVDHLSGMFAFALWDLERQTLFLARDRMGQKPLYVAFDSDTLSAVAFGSELPAVLAPAWVSRQLNLQALGDYLAWGYIPSPATIYQGVQSLPPGCCMEITRGAARTWRYFDPNESAPPLVTDPDAVAGLTRHLVQQAVQRQLVADVPVGCLLSGGIDSSCIAAAMRQVLPREAVRTFTVSFADPRYDESAYAQRVAGHLGTTHKCFRAQPHIADDLPRLCQVFGQPFADSSVLPTHYLSQYVRQEVTVALGGDGGDELFGGYDRYRAMHLQERMPRWLRRLLARPLWQMLPGTHPKSRLTRFRRFAAGGRLPPAGRYGEYMRLFQADTLAGLLKPDYLEAAGESEYVTQLYDSLAGELFTGGRPRSSAQAAMATDRVSYLPEDLLTKVDRASMLHALEVRSPFMDHELVRFAANLSTRQLIMGGKKAQLRRAFAHDLPAEVFQRRKMGFAAPVGDWLRNELRPLLSDLLGSPDSFARSFLRDEAVAQLQWQHQEHCADHSQRLYALLVLELWWKSR